MSDWFPAPLPDNVELGEGTWVHSSYVFLHYRSERPCGLRVGRNTGIYIDSFFELGPEGEMLVGHHCTLAGPIVSTNGRVEIGDRAIVSREVVIADGPVAAPPLPETPSGRAPGTTIVIGDDVWIGTRAVLLPGAGLGDGAIVGAAAVVDFEVPPRAVVAGNPARVVAFAGSPPVAGAPKAGRPR